MLFSGITWLLAHKDTLREVRVVDDVGSDLLGLCLKNFWRILFILKHCQSRPTARKHNCVSVHTVGVAAVPFSATALGSISLAVTRSLSLSVS